jgi:hypothetical protein
MSAVNLDEVTAAKLSSLLALTRALQLEASFVVIADSAEARRLGYAHLLAYAWTTPIVLVSVREVRGRNIERVRKFLFAEPRRAV